MEPLKIVTWNVLHHVHGVNWSESVLRRHPDERERIARIASFVAGLLAAPTPTAVCLQEVSGDQLAVLRAALPARALVFDHASPRVPRVKPAHDTGNGLDDRTEHLVVVTCASPAVRVESRTFANDAGKGFLVVDVGGVRVVNTHVSWGDNGAEQLALLAHTARAAPGASVVVGDFNAARDRVTAAFGVDATYADVSSRSRRTRPRPDGKPGDDIDHVIALRGSVRDGDVLDAEMLSDHNPVAAVVVPT